MTNMPQIIYYEAAATETEIQMLTDHGWEISADQREARLYSEEWSSSQAAIASTRWWIEENREETHKRDLSI